MSSQGFVSLDVTSTQLGLPRDWLREQADAGSIPCLQVRGRRFFDVGAVRDALLNQLERSEVDGASRS